MSIVDLIGAGQPAPAGAKKRTGPEKLRQIGIVFIPKLVGGEEPTLDDAREATGDEVNNSVATLLGRGIGGRKGARLWPSAENKAFACVRDNVQLLFPYLRPMDVEKLFADLGVTPEEFAAKVMAMPKASA